jgi:hypothetical protein
VKAPPGSKRPVDVPEVAILPMSSLERITDLLSDLSVADLTGLISDATRLRAGKLADAKRDLVAEFHSRALAMGLDPEEFGLTLPTPKRKDYRPLVMPDGSEARIVAYMRQHQGRATVRNVSLAAYGGKRPDGASAQALPRLITDMIERGVLVELREGGRGQPGIFALADMMEADEAAE